MVVESVYEEVEAHVEPALFASGEYRFSPTLLETFSIRCLRAHKEWPTLSQLSSPNGNSPSAQELLRSVNTKQLLFDLFHLQ